MYREGLLKEAVSHLFIISDEFAELKNQQPEFMEQLISAARIGRLLATQKPSGVVYPQIWSNTRFRVCLRVQDKSDSTEIIKCQDAVYLKQTGRFYFQVGYNEVFVLSQADWAGGKYIAREKHKKELDTSIDVIDNIGYRLKRMETRRKVEVEKGNVSELINIVKYLDNIAKNNNIKSKPLWLEKISETILFDNLIIKYNYKKIDNILDVVIGEYDIPSFQKQMLLTVPITNEGNTTIYGSTGSGKESLITTLLYLSMRLYSNSEVNYYIMDFGSGSLKMFEKVQLLEIL